MNIQPLPLISIVTPSFNQADYLEECIESVLGQGYPRLEYVIMDGGSTDGSVEIIKKYEKYLTYWQSCPDGGQYRAITEGFRHTTGEIMAWLNSDDKYHPLAFAKVACAFADHPEVAWLTGRKTLWDRTGNLTWIDGDDTYFSRRKFLEGHFNKPFIQQESTFWCRSLWEQAGGSLAHDISLAGDMDLWCRFFRHASLYTLDTMLGGFRSHGEQRSKLQMEVYLQEAMACTLREQQVWQTEPDLLPSPPVYLTLSRERLAGFIQNHAIKPGYPNRIGCWCEYAEDLIYVSNVLANDRHAEVASFWSNEVALFSLTKPKILNWLASDLEVLQQVTDSLEKLLAAGESREAAGEQREALDCYRRAFELSPTWAPAAARLIYCLWRLGEHAEVFGLLSHILALHRYNVVVVRAAYEVLSSCGEHALAQGVCDEYLMFNPHDDEVRSMRNSSGHC